MAQKKADLEKAPEVTVRLMGKSAEFLGTKGGGRSHPFVDLQVKIPTNKDWITPREIIQYIAEQNPLLRDQIVRSDGTPRLSTKILLGDKPPTSLDERLPIEERFLDEEGEVPQAPRTMARRRRRVIVIVIRGGGTVIVIVMVPCDG